MKKLILLFLYLVTISLTVFTQNDTLYIFNDGSITSRIAIKDIDSIIFYQPAPVVTDIVKDIDGNEYNTVQIGEQLWLKENLNVTHYRNGDEIETTTPVDLAINSESGPKYQWAYDGKESNAKIYGRLYTWYAVNDDRGLCPEGWHVPSDNEWKQLEMFLGMSEAETTISGLNTQRGTDEGKRLKSTEYWIGLKGTNETGFTGLPAGGKNPNTGQFVNLGEITFFWTSTTKSGTNAYFRSLDSMFDYIVRADGIKKTGQSVRCIKD